MLRWLCTRSASWCIAVNACGACLQRVLMMLPGQCSAAGGVTTDGLCLEQALLPRAGSHQFVHSV
jgi:hypothetical protein